MKPRYRPSATSPTRCGRAVVGIDRFGESAPAGELYRHFGFIAENVAAVVQRVL